MISEKSYQAAKETAEAAGLVAVVAVLEGLWNQQKHYLAFFIAVSGSLEAAARNDEKLTGLMKEGQ